VKKARALPLSERMAYWKDLVRQGTVSDPRLYPGLVEELRAALRDALAEIPIESVRRPVYGPEV
jgi:hypothetical protein